MALTNWGAQLVSGRAAAEASKAAKIVADEQAARTEKIVAVKKMTGKTAAMLREVERSQS